MKQISAVELAAKMQAGEQVNLIDVREVEEVAAGYISGIVNIPLGLLETRMDELDKSKAYIMVCRSGGRSGQATQFLAAQGFDVTNMAGGMLDWPGDVEKFF